MLIYKSYMQAFLICVSDAYLLFRYFFPGVSPHQGHCEEGCSSCKYTSGLARELGWVCAAV